jgi:hypothetical protein
MMLKRTPKKENYVCNTSIGESDVKPSHYYYYDSKPGAQQLMGVHKVSAFHPFIFQKSGKSTIIRNLAVPRHFVAYLVFRVVRVE